MHDGAHRVEAAASVSLSAVGSTCFAGGAAPGSWWVTATRPRRIWTAATSWTRGFLPRLAGSSWSRRRVAWWTVAAGAWQRRRRRWSCQTGPSAVGSCGCRSWCCLGPTTSATRSPVRPETLLCGVEQNSLAGRWRDVAVLKRTERPHPHKYAALLQLLQLQLFYLTAILSRSRFAAGSGEKGTKKQRPQVALQRCHYGCLPSIVCFPCSLAALPSIVCSSHVFGATARQKVLLSCQASWGRCASAVLLVRSVNFETDVDNAFLRCDTAVL